MSRSGYNEDIDEWALIRWRGQVASSIRGKRGQKLISELAVALEAMPEKRLVREELKTTDGEVCALGAVGIARGITMDEIDPEDPSQVASAFDIAEQLAREIVYENDLYWRESPEQRHSRMLKWARSHIIESPGAEQPKATERGK